MSDTIKPEAEIEIRSRNPNRGQRPYASLIGKGNRLLDNNERVYDGDEFLIGNDWAIFDIEAACAQARTNNNDAPILVQAWFRRKVKP